MNLKRDDYVKVMGANGNYRYGYIEKVLSRGDAFIINLTEEGICKIEFDAEMAKLLGYLPEDYTSLLSDIERQVASLLAIGQNTNEIAKEMSISPTTVRAHLRNLRIKLHLDNKTQLIAFCQGLKL